MSERMNGQRSVGAETTARPLWDAKYAAAGVLAIVLAVLLLDLLPRLVTSKLHSARG